MIELDQKILNELSPGIKDFVIWLNKLDFQTVDSGDGSSYQKGMAGACSFSMVAIKSTAERLVWDADNLFSELFSIRNKINLNALTIEATYSPIDKISIIVISDPDKTGALDWRNIKLK